MVSSQTIPHWHGAFGTEHKIVHAGMVQMKRSRIYFVCCCILAGETVLGKIFSIL